MRYISGNLNKHIRIACLITLSFLAAWGLVMVLAQVKPFWVDEWRVIYNLKYKSPAAIFGQLDFMQQFPRVYLALIKLFTAPFDYSYFTLRFPSYMTGIAAIVLAWRLTETIYSKDNFSRFLFVMILVSSYTFTEYFVQIKQYTMDILLSLIAIAQLLEMRKIPDNGTISARRYLLLCLSFLIAPFFSYTYSIAIAPVYIIIIIEAVQIRGKTEATSFRLLMLRWLPLMIGGAGAFIFYRIDASQLMKDRGMHEFWGSLMMANGFDAALFLRNFYLLFAQVGSGLVFQALFGIAGIIAFFYGIAKSIEYMRRKPTTEHALVAYSCILLLLTLLLFVSGKLPLGEPRLNAFTVPAIAVLIIHWLGHVAVSKFKLAFCLSLAFYAATIGHIYTKSLSGITGSQYARKLDIYVATENAIILAQERKLPIIITPAVAYPYDKTRNLPFSNTVPGDWVLKTFPAYKVYKGIPVYGINGITDLNKCLRILPPYITSVVAGDGTSYSVVKR